MNPQSDELSWLLIIFAIALIAIFAVLLVFRKKISRAIPSKAGRIFRIIYVILCVPGIFLLIEFPYNRDIFAMDAFFVLVNMGIMAAALFAVHFAAQRTRIALGALLLVCFVAGVANGFVVEFRGQPVLASDLLALSTAAEVASGYNYAITNEMLTSFIVLEVFLCVLVVLPKAKVTKLMVMPNIAISALCTMSLVMWYSNTDINEEYDCSVDAWSSRESYEEQGAILCLIQRTQEFTPQPPDWYTTDEAKRRRALTADPYIANKAESIEREAEPNDYEMPSIIVIMNETFSDISNYSAVDSSYTGPYRFKEVCSDALLSGNVYVSALGGSTCNSEYEFLTGSSVGLLGAGIYPYMLYSMEGVDNIADYLSELGYDTSAIHPAESTNWRRNIIYDQMGFDNFYDIETMRNSETIRGLVTDAATYDIILDILSSSETPQFIFDVTIANHGGYETGEIPESEHMYLSINGENNPEIDEYASLIEKSDIEFANFLNDIQQLDRPVVVCMFGDHQPGFADDLAEASTNIEVKDMTLEQAQMRFVTPYIIWTNNNEIRQSYGVGNHKDMGLSYLAANVISAADLPLNEHLAYLCGIQEKLPVVNLNGYMDTQGNWRWHNEESISSDAYWELKIVQYNRLFDN